MLLLALVLASQPAVFERLRSPSATSSTYLKSNWNKYEENYHPTYVLDDNPKTAWTEGADGDGIGEWLELPLSKLKTAAAVRIVIMNGYQKSKNLLEANAAPKKVTVIVLGVNGEETGRAAWALERKMGPQSIEVPVKGGLGSVRLVIDEVHPGKTYKDTCISDVQVFVDSEVAYNAKAEAARQTQALAWMKERIDVAKYFAKLPKEFPWTGTTFSRAGDAVVGKTQDVGYASDVGDLLKNDDAVLKGMAADDRAELARFVAWQKGEKPAGAKMMRHERTSRGAAHAPDGVELGLAAGYLSLADVALTEAAAGSSGRSRAPTYEGGPPVVTSDALVTKRPDGSVEQLRIEVTETEDGRTVRRVNKNWILTYDPKGMLTTATAFDFEDGDGSSGGLETFDIFRLTRDVSGKVSAVKVVHGEATYTYDKKTFSRSASYEVTSTTLAPEPAS